MKTWPGGPVNLCMVYFLWEWLKMEIDHTCEAIAKLDILIISILISSGKKHGANRVSRTTDVYKNTCYIIDSCI